MAGLKFSEDHKRKMAESQYRNKYIFTYSDGKIEEFNSLTCVSKRFGVKNAIVSKWFKRKDLGRNHGILQSNNIIKAEKIGDKNIILLPWKYKQEQWQIAGAKNKTKYYKEKRKLMK
jgi:hypothetical protein